MIYTGGTDGMGWNFGMLFTGFKAWCMEMGCYDTNGTGWEMGIFADDGKSLLGQGGTVG